MKDAWRIAALLIPSSVLKPASKLYIADHTINCSPPNTVIGIETSMIRFSKEGPGNCSPPNTVIGIETAQYKKEFPWLKDCSPPNTVIGIETSAPADGGR